MMNEQHRPGAYEGETGMTWDDGEYSEGEFEDEEGGGMATEMQCALAPSSVWVTGWARSHGWRRAWREGTQPKRARTGERELDYSAVRPVKQRSEERDAEVAETDVDTANAGSAPKRAQLEVTESPPDSSTPGTVGSAEESVSAYVGVEAK
jgi:hypothetical protein